MEPSSFISIWYNRYLKLSTLSHRQLTLILTLVYFLQIGTFVLSLEKITIAPLFSIKGLQLIFWFFASIGLWSFVIIYSSAFALWTAAKCFKGTGTLPQTRGAVIWTLISLIPVGFLLLLIKFAFESPSLGFFASVLRGACYVGIITTLIYGLNILRQAMAEIHHLSAWRSFTASLLGVFLLALLIYGGSAYLMRK